MLTCYLDDSGKDPQSSITVLAGYVAHDESWQRFETEAEHIFRDKKVTLLNAKDLYRKIGEFRNWRVLEKQAFVARICQVMSRHILLGVSMAAEKQQFRAKAKKSERKQTASPYSFCFNVIVDWLLRDIRIGRAANEQGIS